MNALRITGKAPLSYVVDAISTKVLGLRRVTAAGAESDEGAGAAYVKNLSKLVPGEALSLYAAGSNVQVPAEMKDLRVWPIYCLAAAIIFRWFATRKKGEWKPQILAVAIAIGSFTLWIYTQGDWFLRYQIPAEWTYLVKYTMLFWVFVIPALVGGDKPTDNKGGSTDSGDLGTGESNTATAH
jgi:hypothetical protein